MKVWQQILFPWRCDQLLFMSNESDPVLGSIGLDVGGGYDSLWGKTKQVGDVW